MAFVATTNVTGVNPGPNPAGLPDTVQSSVGNIQKVGRFAISLTPASSAATSATVQAFSNTGIGLLTTDTVIVTPTSATAGVCAAVSFVSALDQLSIQFVNPTGGALTAPAGVYYVTVFRVQPLWTAPSVGNQFDW